MRVTGASEEKKEINVEGCRWDMKVIEGSMIQSKTSAHGLTYLDSS